MIIGVPREIHRHEHRVGLSPFAVGRLLEQGHVVFVEREAGVSAHFADHDYQRAGGKIVYEAEEVYQRADLVCRIGALSAEELGLLKPESTVCAFHHLAVAPDETIRTLMDRRISLIGYEIIRDERGELPVLMPFSEMAGHMAVHIAAHYLQNEERGRGILLGNVAGVPPATVLILGAGTVGRTAARQALATGAHVILLDEDLRKLRDLNVEFRGQAVTVVASTERLRKYTPIADVLIGAILIPGGRAPFLVTEEMVRAMKPGSVIIDISIDQGGCIETSRPTALDDPVFVAHDVIHYCVPNLTANIARTASRAMVNASLPYLEALAGKGLERALQEDPGLAQGVYLYRGRMVHQGVAEASGTPSTPLTRLIEEGTRR